MPTLTATDRAIHGLTLTAGAELVVDFTRAPSTVELVVTEPGTAPIYWTVDDTTPGATSRNARVIPAGVIATDSTNPNRIGDTYPTARVRVVSAAAATISVQRG